MSHPDRAERIEPLFPRALRRIIRAGLIATVLVLFPAAYAGTVYWLATYGMPDWLLLPLTALWALGVVGALAWVRLRGRVS